MKTILAVLLLLAFPVLAIPVTFEWDANDEPEVVGYSLYRQMADGTKQLLASPAILEATVELEPGRYTVFVTARTAEGLESPPSDLFTFLVPKKPGKPRIKVALQTSDNGKDWTTVALHEEYEVRQLALFRVVFVEP